MSSTLRTRVFIALVAASIAALGCSGSISTDSAGEDGVDELAAPAEPSDPAANFDGDEGVAEVVSATCGNGSCEPGESCAKCSQDCGACPSCGNGVCSPNEDCSTCAEDCGACPCTHDVCSSGPALVPGCDPCVDQICAVDSFCCDVAWDGICVSEVASVCGQQCPTVCGDGLCNAGESCGSCSQDCGACPVCGDGWCDWTETCGTCSQDCGACPACGDGTCNGSETCGSCSQDCGACVCHDVCVAGTPLDASCGACESQICAVDSFCCQAAWDGLCVSEVATVCGQPCPVACGNGQCEAGETCGSCAQDCGACPVCGDGACEWNESCGSCAQDCGACPVCGDGACGWDESCGSCAQDCGACVCHDVCEAGAPLDPSCGQCESLVCAQDSFCCSGAWDAICVSYVSSLCNQQCP
jgi:hypothetical protein